MKKFINATGIVLIIIIISGIQPSSAKFPVDGTYTELQSGSEIPYSSFDNKVVLIEGFATWCGPCHEEFHQMSLVVDHFKDNLTVVSLSIDPGYDTLAKISTFKHTVETDYSFTATWEIGLDKHSDFINHFSIGVIPSTFLFSSDGSLQKQWTGPALASEIISYIDANVSLEPNAKVGQFIDTLVNNAFFQISLLSLIMVIVYKLVIPKTEKIES